MIAPSGRSWTFSDVCVLAAVAAMPLYIVRFALFGIPTNVFEIIAMAAMVVFWASAWRNEESRKNYLKTIVKLRPVYILGVALTIIALMSTLWSPDTRSALGEWKGWFLVPFVFGGTIGVWMEGRRTPAVLWTLWGILITVSTWAILQALHVIGPVLYQQGDPSFSVYLNSQPARYFGPFESPNYLAMVVVPLVCMSGLLALQNVSNRMRVVVVAGLILPFTALLLSGSKGGWLAALAAIALIAVGLVYRLKGKPRLFLGVLSLIVSVAALNLVLSRVNVDSGGNRVRQEIYSKSWELVKEHPIRGIGLGGFHQEIARISAGDGSFIAYGLPSALHPHNLMLALWLNVGVAGLLLFIGIVVAAGASLIRKYHKEDCWLECLLVAAALVSIIVHGIVDTTYFKNDLSVLFWVVIIFAMRIRATHDEN